MLNVGDLLRGALTPPKEKNRAALTRPDDMAGLLRAIEGYQGNVTTKSALRLAPILFVRPGELRRMEWKELDLESRQWRIPGRKMKMGEEHIVPLPNQAIDILQHLEQVNGHSDYVLPSIRSASRPMSENTITGALRRLGYSGEEMTSNGFHAITSTRLNQIGWNPELIERQLTQKERNKSRSSYNRSQYLERRHEMMQGWADYLENLRENSSKETAPQELSKPYVRKSSSANGETDSAPFKFVKSSPVFN